MRRIHATKADALILSARAALRDNRHHAVVEPADRADNAVGLARAILDALDAREDGCPAGCKACRVSEGGDEDAEQGTADKPVPVLSGPAESEHFRARFVNLGEGSDGDYRASDPQDENLLRLDIEIRENGEFVDLADGSYCTQVRASTSAEKQAVLLVLALRVMDHALQHGRSLRRTARELSWLDAGCERVELLSNGGFTAG